MKSGMTEKMICPRCGMNMNIDDGQDTLTCSNCGYQERVIINKTETSHQKEQTETSNSDELNYLSGFTGGITDVQDDQRSDGENQPALELHHLSYHPQFFCLHLQ